MPLPEFHTTRLRLRTIVKDDQASIFMGLSHPEVIRYYGVRYTTYEETSAQMKWYETLEKEQTGIWWAMCLHDRKFIGACGFNNWKREHRRAEVGFWMLPEFQGKRMMAEALRCICDYAFASMDLHRIEGFVESENIASKHLLNRLGFACEGTMRECEWKDGRYISLDIYALIRPNPA